MPKDLMLAAVDFSKGSKAALLWAIDYSDKTGTALSIVHVIHDPADTPGSYQRHEQNILKPISEIAQGHFDVFLAKILEKRPESRALKLAEILMVEGIPAKRIIAIAKETGATHIVLGCLGQGKLPDIFVGSVAQRVLKKSHLPVTIIKTKSQKPKKKKKKKHKDKQTRPELS